MDGQIKLRQIDSDRDHYEEVYDVWKQRSNHLTEEMQWITDQLSLHVNEHFMEISRNGTAENEHMLMNSLSMGSAAGMYHTKRRLTILILGVYTSGIILK